MHNLLFRRLWFPGTVKVNKMDHIIWKAEVLAQFHKQWSYCLF